MCTICLGRSFFLWEWDSFCWRLSLFLKCFYLQNHSKWSIRPLDSRVCSFSIFFPYLIHIFFFFFYLCVHFLSFVALFRILHSQNVFNVVFFYISVEGFRLRSIHMQAQSFSFNIYSLNMCPLNNCFTLISPIQSLAKMHFTFNRNSTNKRHSTHNIHPFAMALYCITQHTYTHIENPIIQSRC